MPRFHLEQALADGDLVEVLERWEKPTLPIHLVYPHRRQLSPRVRVFADWLADLYAERFANSRQAI
ncbi:LysR substrate-binding domain-containing protein [Modicisalibacter radicis]|uniref:LysR substrate-binding domain-containing protein n=1 Tax=Halomonas sp. EAR18 TaxID=2518972 RepID=UPI001FCEAFAD|nr:LysR substrate-binding domain-containing protein [Halomonas sp. EAR18]